MTKDIKGYVRDIPGGVGEPNIPVTVILEPTGLPVAVGGMHMGTTNPMTTDANGYFSWSCELSPGPLRVETGGTGDKKVRSGREVMQSGSAFISDLTAMWSIFSDGVFQGYKNQFTTTASGLNLTVQTGGGHLKSHLFETATNRVIAVPSNNTLATRRDLLVLAQDVAGSYVGRQRIYLVPGTVSGVDPTLNTDPNVFEQAIYRVAINNGASSVTLTDLRTYASISSLTGFASTGHTHASTGVKFGYAEKSYTTFGDQTAILTTDVTLDAGATYDIFQFGLFFGGMTIANSSGFAQVGSRIGPDSTNYGNQVGTAGGERPLYCFSSKEGYVAPSAPNNKVTCIINARRISGTGVGEVQGGLQIIVCIPRAVGAPIG